MVLMCLTFDRSDIALVCDFRFHQMLMFFLPGAHRCQRFHVVELVANRDFVLCCHHLSSIEDGSTLGKATLTAASDMWAVACCLFCIHCAQPQQLIHNVQAYQILVTSTASFPEVREEKLAPAIQYRLQRCLPKSIAQVAQRCLAIAPAKRDTARELRKSLLKLLNAK